MKLSLVLIVIVLHHKSMSECQEIISEDVQEIISEDVEEIISEEISGGEYISLSKAEMSGEALTIGYCSPDLCGPERAIDGELGTFSAIAEV